MAPSATSDHLDWYDPALRGVLPVDGLHVSRSLRRLLRAGGWTATLDADFDGTVAACADRPETWINRPLRAAYRELHAHGVAHSVEVWHAGRFAGGLFGVALGGAFFGESMVTRISGGSKLALWWLTRHLARCGFVLCDTQMMSPHLESLGGREIPRAAYRRQLARALRVETAGLRGPLPDAQALLQETTQTS